MKQFESLSAFKQFVGSIEEVEAIPDSCYKESRYISGEQFDALEKVILDFKPFDNMWIYFSKVSGRLYAGHINLEGHGASFQIRPITIKSIIESDLLSELYADWAYKLGCNINLEASYTI